MTAPGVFRHVELTLERMGGEFFPLKLNLDLGEEVQYRIYAALNHKHLFEKELSWLIRNVVDRGDIVFDIGANCGFFTALMGQLVKPDGLVVACEANPGLLPLLNGHISLNGLNALVIDKAIGEAEGTVTFRQTARDDHNGAILADNAPAADETAPDPISVPMTSLDRIIEENGLPLDRIKFIKLDIEGYEMHALKGAETLLASPNLHFLSVEFNEPQLRSWGTSGKELRLFLQDFGFETYLMADNGTLPKHVPIDIDVVLEWVSNILFARPKVLSQYWKSVNYSPPINQPDQDTPA